MQENRISIKLSAAEVQQIVTAIQSVATILGTRVIALSVDDRKTLPKMNDGTLPFVQKALEYCKTNTKFVPAYIEIGELQIDVDAVSALLQIQHPLNQLAQNIDDTVMLCGSEAYVAALGFYQNVKQATKMKIPGAEPIYNDLSARFTKVSRKKSPGDEDPKQS
jgi:hypothetical protein